MVWINIYEKKMLWKFMMWGGKLKDISLTVITILIDFKWTRIHSENYIIFHFSFHTKGRMKMSIKSITFLHNKNPCKHIMKICFMLIWKIKIWMKSKCFVFVLWMERKIGFKNPLILKENVNKLFIILLSIFIDFLMLLSISYQCSGYHVT